MDDLKDFYNSILHINRKDFENEIKKIVKEETEDLISKSNELDGFCRYLANQIECRINEEIGGVDIHTIDLKDFGLVDHTILIIEYMTNSKMKRLLVDPSFTQFVKKDNSQLLKLESWPSVIIDKNILSNLLKYGVVEIDNALFNNYLNSFGGKITNFSLDDYLLESRIGKKI